MYEFNYHKPSSVADAAALLGRTRTPELLAGGQTLIAAMKLRLASPSARRSGRDQRADRHQNRRRRADDRCHDAAWRGGGVQGRAAIDSGAGALAASIGDRMVRNMGTLGGSIANNDPAADYPAAVLGLGATISTNKRKIPADAFFKGIYETALEPGELITSISFPVPKRAGYTKFKNPASRYAIVGVL